MWCFTQHMASFFFFVYKYVSVDSLFLFVSVLQFLNPFTTWSNRLVPSFVISFDCIIIGAITEIDFTESEKAPFYHRKHTTKLQIIDENSIISNFGFGLSSILRQ